MVIRMIFREVTREGTVQLVHVSRLLLVMGQGLRLFLTFELGPYDNQVVDSKPQVALST